MVRGSERISKPVKIEVGQVHIAGGFTTTPAAVKSKTIEGSDEKQHIFVGMGKNKRWLLASKCGPNCGRRGSAFPRSSLVDTLRDCMIRKANGIDDIGEDAAVAAVDDDCDPVDEIGSAPKRGPNAIGLDTDRQGRARYSWNRLTNCIATVNVASRCPEIDPTCTQMRPVKLYINDRRTVWLSIDDVPWAIRYLHDQVHLEWGSHDGRQ